MEGRIAYGYARKTSNDKDAESQVSALRRAGILPENIFVDQPAGKEKFKQLMARFKFGDVLVIENLGQLDYNFHEFWYSNLK